MPPVFTWPVRVYYEDTDAGGIVFYANYLKYFERARTEWLRALGISPQALAQEEGAMFVVRSTNVDYHAPARLDDELKLTMSIERIGGASIVFMQQAWRGEQLLSSAKVKVGCVDTHTLRARPVPDVAAAKMQAASLTQ